MCSSRLNPLICLFSDQWLNISLAQPIWRLITAKNQCCNSTFNMGSKHLILHLIISHGLWQFFTTQTFSYFSACNNELGEKIYIKIKSYDLLYRKLRFFQLKVTTGQVKSCSLANWKLPDVKLKIVIWQFESCDLSPLVQKPPKLCHTNFVEMTSV